MRIYDISPPISASLAVWPGDTPPTREILLDIAAGANLTLSTLRATVHLGAHADAPSHYAAGGRSVDEQPLLRYLGPCQVVRPTVAPGCRIGPGDVSSLIRAPRVLFCTGTFPDPRAFREDFAALSPHLVDWLHERGVRLVGIDTPSVDVFDDRQLVSHARCFAHDIAILEGLVLADVPDGVYELVALPLALVGFDASPVRAILRDVSNAARDPAH